MRIIKVWSCLTWSKNYIFLLSNIILNVISRLDKIIAKLKGGIKENKKPRLSGVF